jgi:GMP synthase (glutamine-hydrolysing)
MRKGDNNVIDPHREKVLILDFGSQYTQLIARRIRELHVYCEIHPYLMPMEQIRKFAPRGIVLSGGPRSVYESDAPLVGREILELEIPVLGICYGLQLINYILGGKVSPAATREYGRKHFTINDHQDLFAGLALEELVWMSHGDHIDELAAGLEIIGSSDTCPAGAIRDRGKSAWRQPDDCGRSHRQSTA